MNLKKLVGELRRKNNFLITAHTNLEGDALGSEIAMYLLLKALKKRVVIVNEDAVPYGYEFLPQVRNASRLSRNRPSFDCLVILDCSDLNRCGDVAGLGLKGKTIINIDHHISNAMFGNINWVNPLASSTSEMIYQLYKKARVPFSRDSATVLYVGMLTDTGSFRHSNTTASTHRAVAELMEYGLDIRGIYSNIYENIPYSDMRLLVQVLPKMKRLAGGKVIWFELDRKAWGGKKIFFDLSEHILSFGRSIKDVQVVCLFKENLGPKADIRINLRSQGRVDVNKIARFFGGGGHKTASGATIPGQLSIVRRRVLAKIKEAVDKI